MRRHIFTSASIITASTLIGCASSGLHGDEAAYEEKPIVHTVTPEDVARARSKQAIAGNSAVMYVNGMGCPLCATNIDKQLKRLPGIKDVKVDLGVGVVTLTLQPGAPHPSPARLGDAVEDAGFTLVKIEER